MSEPVITLSAPGSANSTLRQAGRFASPPPATTGIARGGYPFSGIFSTFSAFTFGSKSPSSYWIEYVWLLPVTTPVKYAFSDAHQTRTRSPSAIAIFRIRGGVVIAARVCWSSMAAP